MNLLRWWPLRNPGAAILTFNEKAAWSPGPLSPEAAGWPVRSDLLFHGTLGWKKIDTLTGASVASQGLRLSRPFPSFI